LADFGDDFDEAVGEAVEETAAGSFWKSAAEHFEDVLGGLQGIEEPCRVRTGWRSSKWCWRGWDKMSGVGASQMILTLQVGLGDIEIMQGHRGTLVAEYLHDGQGDAGAQTRRILAGDR
jgi:hypothetical protein